MEIFYVIKTEFKNKILKEIVNGILNFLVELSELK